MERERIQLDASTQNATTGRYNDNKIELPRCYITLGDLAFDIIRSTHLSSYALKEFIEEIKTHNAYKE